MTVNDNKAYPLNWPAGWEREYGKKRAQFSERRTIYQAFNSLTAEVRRLGGTDCIMSTNLRLRLDGAPISDQRSPDDPGAAIYFNYKGKPRVFACDRWNRVVDNIWAIARHIENIRASERYGVGDLDRAFTGYDALPAPTVVKWWDILGVSQMASKEEVREAYKHLVRIHHPDRGGDAEKFIVIQKAYEVSEAA